MEAFQQSKVPLEKVPPEAMLVLYTELGTACDEAREIERLVKRASHGASRRFGGPGGKDRKLGREEFLAFAGWVQDKEAHAVFRKVFLCKHHPNPMQEFWFNDKKHVERKRWDVLQHYVIVHVH